jgi:hypothetical protein
MYVQHNIVARSPNKFINFLFKKNCIPLLTMRRILYRFSVADTTRNVRKSSCKVLHISALFQLQFDYLKIFIFKVPIKNYTENSPTKAALIQADRQTNKYEANWRLCDSANAHKTHMWQPRRKNHKAGFQLRPIPGVKKQSLRSYLPLGIFKYICTSQEHVILSHKRHGLHFVKTDQWLPTETSEQLLNVFLWP